MTNWKARGPGRAGPCRGSSTAGKRRRRLSRFCFRSRRRRRLCSLRLLLRSASSPTPLRSAAAPGSLPAPFLWSSGARRTAARRRCCWRRRRFRFHDFFLSHRRSFLLLLFLRVVRAPARPLLRYRPGPRPSSKLRLPQTAAPRSRRRGRGGWRRPGSSRGTATKFDYLPFLRVCRRRGRGGSSRGRARQSLGAGPRARGGLFPRRGLWSTVLRRLLPGRRGRGKG